MVPDSPDVRRGAGRRGRRVRERQARHADHRLLLHPTRRHHRAGGAGDRARLPAAGRPGLRRRGRRQGGRACPSWSAATPSRLRRRGRGFRRGRQDDRARRAVRRRADRQGGQPADRRRQHPTARRGGRVRRGLRRGHRGRAEGARRRPGRQQGAGPEGRQHARPVVQPGLPDRAAPQGSGHRHRRGPGGRRGHPARRGGRPADGLRAWPTATAGWTTRRCCAGYSGSPARTPTATQPPTSDSAS